MKREEPGCSWNTQMQPEQMHPPWAKATTRTSPLQKHLLLILRFCSTDHHKYLILHHLGDGRSPEKTGYKCQSQGPAALCNSEPNILRRLPRPACNGILFSAYTRHWYKNNSSTTVTVMTTENAPSKWS